MSFLNRLWASIKQLFSPLSQTFMDPITQIYYFPTDHEGKEIGEGIPITLKANGTADVSKLPQDFREQIEAMGVPNELKTGSLFPRDGKRFLLSLLYNSNGYRRFSRSL